MLKVKLSKRRGDPDLPRKEEIAQEVDDLCQYLAAKPIARRNWAEFIGSGEFPHPSDLSSKDRKYISIFTEARERNDGKRLDDLRGAVPEGLVFHLLNNHPDSVGQAQREVYVRIENNGDVWESNDPERTHARSLDVAFWDDEKKKGRGFECKVAKVQENCEAIVDLLATINEKTSGRFETVLFSFCKFAYAIYKTLWQDLVDQSVRTRLRSIQFVGYEHLLGFDGTTSCVSVKDRLHLGLHEW